MHQFGLRTIMLLIAVAAAWTAYFTGRKSIERDLQAIEAMHALAPELLIRNRNEYACLQIDRSDDIREYHCYLPPGQNYKLQLLWSKEFELNAKTLQPDVSATLTAGKHKILLNELPDKVVVTVDEERVFDVLRDRPVSHSSSSTGASYQFNSQWYPLDQPLTLLRLHENSTNQVMSKSGSGIALWIELAD